MSPQGDHLLLLLSPEGCHFTIMVGFEGLDLFGQLDPQATFLPILELCPKIVAYEPGTEAHHGDPRVQNGSNGVPGNPEPFYLRSVLWKDEYRVAFAQIHVRSRDELWSFIDGLKLISLHFAVAVEYDTFF